MCFLRALVGCKSREELFGGLPEWRLRPRRQGKPKLAAGLVELPDPEQELAEVEADTLGARKSWRQRPEPGEGKGRVRLREEADRSGALRLGVARGELRGRCEL